MLSIPIMAKAEEQSKRCDLDICYVYASKKEMADYIAGYARDLDALRSTVVATFQDIYRSVVVAGREYYNLLFAACEDAELFDPEEKARKTHIEAGTPLSKNWVQRRGKLLTERIKQHVAQLDADDLKIQEIAAIQDSLDEALERLLEAITDMYSRLASHLKTKRDKERLKWSKIGVFVGGGGSLAKLGMGAL